MDGNISRVSYVSLLWQIEILVPSLQKPVLFTFRQPNLVYILISIFSKIHINNSPLM